MRQCDAYKISAMVTNGSDDKAILKHFENHYDEETIKKFIPKRPDEELEAKKKDAKGKPKGKSSDPLG